MEFDFLDVQYILDKLIGSLITLTAEGKLLSQDPYCDVLRKKHVWKVVSPIDACQNCMRLKYTLSQTLNCMEETTLCLEHQTQHPQVDGLSKAKRTQPLQKESVQTSSIVHSTSTPGETPMQLLAVQRRNFIHQGRQWERVYARNQTPPHLLHVYDERVGGFSQKPHHSDEQTCQKFTKQKIRPGCWVFVGPGGESTHVPLQPVYDNEACTWDARKTSHAMRIIYKVRRPQGRAVDQTVSATGQILSVRAFKIGSLYGWDILVPTTEDSKVTVGHSLPGSAAFLQAIKDLLVSHKMTKQSKPHPVPPPPALRKSLGYAGRKPLRSGELEVFWQLVPCSRNTDRHEKPLPSKNTAHIQRHQRGCHDKDVACSCTSYNAIITEAMPNMVKELSLSCQWLKELTRTTDKERFEKSWIPHGASGNFTLSSIEQHQEQHAEPFYMSAIHRTKPEKAIRKGSTTSSPQLLEDVVKERGLVPGGLIQTKVDKAFASNSSIPWARISSQIQSTKRI